MILFLLPVLFSCDLFLYVLLEEYTENQIAAICHYDNSWGWGKCLLIRLQLTFCYCILEYKAQMSVQKALLARRIVLAFH